MQKARILRSTKRCASLEAALDGKGVRPKLVAVVAELWPNPRVAGSHVATFRASEAAKLRVLKHLQRGEIPKISPRCNQWRRRELNPRPQSRKRWRLRA